MNFPSSFWTWIKSFKDSTLGKVTCIWHIERVQIGAIKFERTQIHCFTTVSLPSSSSLLKVPNDDDGVGVGDIGSRGVNDDDNDDDDQHYRSSYDI